LVAVGLGGDGVEQFGPLAFETLRFTVAPGDGGSLSLLVEGDVDATAPQITNRSVSDVREEEDLELVTSPSRTVYHVGFNSRREPLRNSQFRRAITSLFDREHIVETVFDGEAVPLATPMVDEKWTPEDLQWNGDAPEVPFAGTDGELDVEQARDHFEEAGFQYTEDGRLVY
ncbi:MAG: ABC transporter substrate-binding protein, partial [Halovenus sp.]